MKTDDMIGGSEVASETSRSPASSVQATRPETPDSDTNIRLGAGYPEPYGANPADNAPGHFGAFEPLYVCLLHVRFEPDWRLTINHASYRYQGQQTPDARLAKAREIFTDKLGGNYQFGEQAMQDLGHVSYAWLLPDHQPDHPRDSTTFADFKFRSPTEIFIFLESPTVYTGVRERLLACTKYGSKPTPLHENYSFYGADSVPDSAMGALLRRGRMIRVRNYAKLRDGSSSDTQAQEYALNIHFKIPGGPAGLIPMVLDPDTGNGMGNEP